MKYLKKAKLIENTVITDDCRRLKLECPEIAAEAAPGQFVQVRTWDENGPLLSRPISIAGVSNDRKHIELWVRIVGKGTKAICSAGVGDEVTLTGPLGNGFKRPEAGELIYTAGGSLGAAPLRFFAQRFCGCGDLKCVCGAATACDMSIFDDPVIKSTGAVLTTDDGTMGKKGFVTDALNELLDEKAPDRIIACGPHAMLKAVAAIAAERRIKCEVSLDTYMSCGIGACMGCAVPMSAEYGKPYAHACTDGPVFDSKMIDWEAF